MAGTEKMDKVQRNAVTEVIAAMQRFEWDMHHRVPREGRVPDE